MVQRFRVVVQHYRDAEQRCPEGAQHCRDEDGRCQEEVRHFQGVAQRCQIEAGMRDGDQRFPGDTALMVRRYLVEFSIR